MPGFLFFDGVQLRLCPFLAEPKGVENESFGIQLTGEVASFRLLEITISDSLRARDLYTLAIAVHSLCLQSINKSMVSRGSKTFHLTHLTLSFLGSYREELTEREVLHLSCLAAA